LIKEDLSLNEKTGEKNQTTDDSGGYSVKNITILGNTPVIL